MSMRAGTRIRTYKPVVYKPSENAVVASDKINDRKFMFLSEETKPDYRPIDRRSEIRPSPQIDHRPLGADSYNTSLQVSTGCLLNGKVFCMKSVIYPENKIHNIILLVYDMSYLN